MPWSSAPVTTGSSPPPCWPTPGGMSFVLEAQDQPGGAVTSAQLTPGFVSDLYSAFYPLSVASPALRDLNFEDHGLRWAHAPAVVGHARNADDTDAVIYRDIVRTAMELDRHHCGDGRRWCDLFEQWEQIKQPLLDTLFSPFPPLRGPLGLLRRLGTAGALRLAHLLLLPAGVMAQHLFDGDAARLLLLGNAMHADVPIDAPASGVMGFLLMWDTPVLKVNYALDAKIPWRSKDLADAGTVHLGADHDGLIRWVADLNTRTLPENPFMLFGQMTTADPTRSAAGTERAWAYTHLPRGLADDESAERLAERVDRVLEQHAPGFTDHVVGKTTQRPSDLEASDANLHTGAVNGGTSQLFQQLIFRPAPGFGRAETPLQNVFLGSAGASPGGGVHGVCGRNAARAALAADGPTGWPRRRINRAVSGLLVR